MNDRDDWSYFEGTISEDQLRAFGWFVAYGWCRGVASSEEKLEIVEPPRTDVRSNR